MGQVPVTERTHCSPHHCTGPGVSSCQQTPLLHRLAVDSLGSFLMSTYIYTHTSTVTIRNFRPIIETCHQCSNKTTCLFQFTKVKVKITLHFPHSTLPDCFVTQHGIKMQEDSHFFKSNPVVQTVGGEGRRRGQTNSGVASQQLKDSEVFACFPHLGFSLLSPDQYLKLHSVLSCIYQMQIKAFIKQKGRIHFLVTEHTRFSPMRTEETLGFSFVYLFN